MSVVFAALAMSGISFVKLFGVGLMLAVLADAFIIRGMLVPAFMRLAGDANWWLPFGKSRNLPSELSSNQELSPQPLVVLSTRLDNWLTGSVGEGGVSSAMRVIGDLEA